MNDETLPPDEPDTSEVAGTATSASTDPVEDLARRDPRLAELLWELDYARPDPRKVRKSWTMLATLMILVMFMLFGCLVVYTMSASR